MIIGGTRGYVVAIDEATGDELWRTKLDTGSFFNAASAGDVMVLMKDKIVLASCNGHMWGLDLRGRILWHNGLRGLGNYAVCLAAEGVAIQYVHVIERLSPP